ncbi:hypothetical protein BS333_14020 [Vibrio azureus]|uniref:trimethyllysine dioxygenase n=1 Tax=Vibrio azureus NBRC 104587 TaxID=1219077 RepID=U3AL53_9VIBR|nr:TauD/TfdA family dioxygenase [Vibrio azureus]AUI87532.1 hypothetical protein BS333_14020 [Vibrio azureus]GAD74500.1 hypothetical protein VAZ01S_011_00280 [Vibrio azureus NBRC 104587]
MHHYAHFVYQFIIQIEVFQMEIESIVQNEYSLLIRFRDGQAFDLPYMWFKDHSKSHTDWDHKTHQRVCSATDLFQSSIPTQITVEEGSKVMIYWQNNHEPSEYTAQDLYSKLKDGSDHLAQFGIDNQHDIKLWKNIDLIGDAAFRFQFYQIQKAADFNQMLMRLKEYGFVVVSECPTTIDSVENIANRIGYVRQTIFGGLWQFSANQNRDDSAYTDLALGSHTDSTYSHDAPGLQMLLCCHYDAQGGASTMVDGFMLANEILKNRPDLHALLKDVPIMGRYIGDGVNLAAQRCVLRYNRCGKLEQVSFNHYDREPLSPHLDNLQQVYEALVYFETLASSEQYQWKYILKPGEMIIFDNWRVLHGRDTFVGERKLAGCYINREDFESALRLC